MKCKRLLIFTGMLLLLTLSLGMAAAQENTTDAVCNDNDMILKDTDIADEDYNAEIYAEDITMEYQSDEEYGIEIYDLNGNPIDDANPAISFDGKREYDDLSYTEGDGEYYFCNYYYPDAGNHKVQFKLDDGVYKAKTVEVNVKITKIPVQLTLKKYVTTTKEYAVMKATVKDQYGEKISEGKVKFKINGKTYTVNVKNGVATKKIKLGKAKTYTYTATFTSKNYKTKTASSKVYIKKTKKYYTLKIRSTKLNKYFKAKLSYKQYVKILNAKNKGKYGYADVDTGIKRPPEWGGGHYYVGLSTKDEYFTYYGYELGEYIFLRASSYLEIKKINLYTYNF